MKKSIVLISLMIVLTSTEIRTSSYESPVEILMNKNQFIVKDDKGVHPIENCWLDTRLMKLVKNEKALSAFLKYGYITAHEDKGNYILKSHVRGPGGGPTGAAVGFWIGRGTVWLGAAATIYVTTSAVSTPAGGSIATPALIAAWSPVIESTSNTVALGCGILGGILTGPF